MKEEWVPCASTDQLNMEFLTSAMLSYVLNPEQVLGEWLKLIDTGSGILKKCPFYQFIRIENVRGLDTARLEEFVDHTGRRANPLCSNSYPRKPLWRSQIVA